MSNAFQQSKSVNPSKNGVVKQKEKLFICNHLPKINKWKKLTNSREIHDINHCLINLRKQEEQEGKKTQDFF
jgi:hypothetical protein